MGYYRGGSGMTGAGVGGGGGETFDSSVRTKVADAERRLERLELEHRVLWELVRDGLKLTEVDLDARVKEMDLRDGKADGKISVVPLRCPSCKRVSSSKNWKCLYCGQDFEKYAY